ncbi:energy transducer TonB family protein [Novosphingobium guangzhouense]|nr:energy transducer TonB [Novosphingobium guangzhouense]
MKHLAVVSPIPPDREATRHAIVLQSAVELASGYRIDIRSRLVGMAGACLVPLVGLAGLFLSWQTYTAAPKPSSLTVYDVAAPAPTPAPQPQTAAKAEPEPERFDKPVLDRPQIEPPLVMLPDADRGPVVPLPSAPLPEAPTKARPQPDSQPAPAPAAPSNARPTWEGSVLGALNKVKRYPREARFSRQQGVPYIRFAIDRDGRVLSVQLERSSGVRSLDQEALALPRRAQPLPAPPPEVKGATIELVVPVEFFIR